MRKTHLGSIRNAVREMYSNNKENPNFKDNRAFECRAYTDALSVKFDRALKVTTIERALRLIRAVEEKKFQEVNGNK